MIDNKREYPMEVQAVVNEKTMPINPVALTWTSENDGIATIGATDGVLRGVADGTTTITGKVGSFVGTANVSVEIPTGEVMPIAEYKDGEWKTRSLAVPTLLFLLLKRCENQLYRQRYGSWRIYPIGKGLPRVEFA